MDLKSTGKTKEEIKEMYNKYFYETFQRFDFIAEKGEDDYVIDETGKRYLDFMAGIAVNSAGHCNKKVVEAIMEQCQQMMHASNYCYTIPMVMLAQRICDAIGMEKIYFQNSGAEANEVMIKLARKYGKDNFWTKPLSYCNSQEQLSWTDTCDSGSNRTAGNSNPEKL